MEPLGNTDQTFEGKPHVQKREVEKPTCSKCGGVVKTHSTEISECMQYQVQYVECTECKHTGTVVSKRRGAPKYVRAIA